MCGRLRLKSGRREGSGGFIGKSGGKSRRTTSRRRTPEGVWPLGFHSLGRLMLKVTSREVARLLSW